MRAGDEWRGGSISVVLVLMLALWSDLQAAPAEARRIALVIGNGNYAEFSDLRNPANDARAMGGKLESVGFTLVGGQVHVDVTQRRMASLLTDLENQVWRTSGVEAALVYYSGHGVAEDNQNWLVPVDDGDIRYREDVPRYAIVTNEVMGSLERAGGRLHILILDACRNSPLPSRYETRGRTTKGLARMGPGSGEADQMIVYAAAPGKEAYDGQGELSPFTTALVDEMDVPGRRLVDMMATVRGKVRRQTAEWVQGAQVPWVNSSMETPFSFTCPPDDPRC